jgi:CrcB protein
MSPAAWCAFLVAAGLGAPVRYLVDGAVADRTRGSFPWGTFAVNVTGSFVLGGLTGLGLWHDLGATTRLVLGTGGMGAYTTFSTYAFETVRLADEGDTATAARTAAAGLLASVAAAAVGLTLAYAL